MNTEERRGRWYVLALFLVSLLTCSAGFYVGANYPFYNGPWEDGVLLGFLGFLLPWALALGLALWRSRSPSQLKFDGPVLPGEPKGGIPPDGD